MITVSAPTRTLTFVSNDVESYNLEFTINDKSKITSVKVNDQSVTADDDDIYKVDLTLEEGVNMITVEATNEHNVTVTKTLFIYRFRSGN